jgi:hypothetical protein
LREGGHALALNVHLHASPGVFQVVRVLHRHVRQLGCYRRERNLTYTVQLRYNRYGRNLSCICAQ